LELHAESLTAGKTHLLPNYQKPFKLTEEQLPESLQSCVEGKFLVVFGGNMGKPQQLENVLQLAKYASRYKNVLFLILGEGVQADKVKKDAETLGLANMHIAGTMPKHIYQQLLQKCHVGLISLNIRFTIPNIPSKALDYWNVGLPILASIDKATDFGQILDETGTGLWAYADDAASWHHQFDRLYFDRTLCQSMATLGRAYFMKEVLPSQAYNTIMNHVEAKSNRYH
jgi:TPR repeat protein